MDKNNVDINTLLKNLYDDNDEIREDAASALVGITDKRIVPFLLKSYESDENPGVKYFVKKALSIIQKEHGDIKKILAELSAAKKPSSINEADDGNSSAAEKNSLSGVRQTLFEDMPADTREAVDTILRRIREKDVSLIEEAFEQLSEEEDPYIKATYISAVGRLGDKPHAAAITRFLSDVDFRVIANTVEALERLGDSKCVEELIKLISHRDSRIRANVIKALWTITDSNMSINRHVVGKLRNMCESDSEEMRESALYVLSEIADEEAIDILDKIVSDGHDEIKEKASAMLEKAKITYSERKKTSGDEVYINGVIEKLSRGAADQSKGIDPATRSRIDEIQSFIDSNDRDKLPLILKSLKSETNAFVRATLVSAVGKLGGRSEFDALLPFVNDSDARVIANVVQALENLGNPECVEHIVKLVAHHDNRVRANTVKAIWKYAHTNVTANRIVLERLKEMMFSTKTQMRESAIYVLSEIGDEDAIDLLSIAANDKDPEIKERAGQALNNALKLKKEREVRASQLPVTDDEINKIPSIINENIETDDVPVEETKSVQAADSLVESGNADNSTAAAAQITEKSNVTGMSLKNEAAGENEKPMQSSTDENLKPAAGFMPSETTASSEIQSVKNIDEAARLEIEKIQKLIDEQDSSSLNILLQRLIAEKNPFIKATLVSAVGRLGNRENMDAVLNFLNDDDMRVVANAAEALENLGNPKCVEELIKHINHADNRVRANVVKAVWKYAQSNLSAGRIILARLKTMMFSTKAQMRESALYVLGEIASDEAMELISIALSDKVESVQAKAKEAYERAEAKRMEAPAPAIKKSFTRTPAATVQSSSSAVPPSSSSSSASAARSSAPPKDSQPPVAKSQSSSSSSVRQALKPDLPPAAAPVRRISLFKLLFILAFFFSISIAGGFSMYWFIIEGKDYAQLVEFISSLTSSEQNLTMSESSSSDNAVSGKGAGQTSAAADNAKRSFTVNDHLDAARQNYNEGFFSESINSLSKLIEKYPQNTDLKKVLLDSYFKRGQTLFNLEIFEAAKMDFDKIISMDGGGGYSQKAQSYVDKIAKYIKK